VGVSVEVGTAAGVASRVCSAVGAGGAAVMVACPHPLRSKDSPLKTKKIQYRLDFVSCKKIPSKLALLSGDHGPYSNIETLPVLLTRGDFGHNRGGHAKPMDKINGRIQNAPEKVRL
jgi:hypothetical protein